MKAPRGVKIEAVRPGSPAARAGIKGGDVITAIDGSRVSDVIDYMFCIGSEAAQVDVFRNGSTSTVLLKGLEDEPPGLELEHFKVKTCRNKCVFCFVSQLPRGLRRPLYVKDEDYRMSFLYGNYVTLTNLTDKDRNRIVSQNLSPLYISVHTTDRALRARMLGNQKAPDVMKELRFFAEHKIRMHTQIVLCPGLNDGAELKKTVRDLYSLYPYVASVAVVPVGLTRHGNISLKPVEEKDARAALDIVGAFQNRFTKKHGDALVYASDEMYIKDGMPFPPLNSYGDLPQIENGVGMVPLFRSQARKLDIPSARRKRKKFVTFTGESFHPYLRRLIQRLRKKGYDIDLLKVENGFFGKSVTVTGLLTGRDVIKSLTKHEGDRDVLLVPGCVLREGGDVFLDNVSVEDIEKAMGLKAKVIEPDPQGLLEALTV